ncbi:MAG: hypothetical protein HRT47_11735 [Candidatus Caenarcaniphilales bacterium]|nr:hypothetical protein [Candidatus Caenarcaniphilales bacterium]
MADPGPITSKLSAGIDFTQGKVRDAELDAQNLALGGKGSSAKNRDEIQQQRNLLSEKRLQWKTWTEEQKTMMDQRLEEIKAFYSGNKNLGTV